MFAHQWNSNFLYQSNWHFNFDLAKHWLLFGLQICWILFRAVIKSWSWSWSWLPLSIQSTRQDFPGTIRKIFLFHSPTLPAITQCGARDLLPSLGKIKVMPSLAVIWTPIRCSWHTLYKTRLNGNSSMSWFQSHVIARLSCPQPTSFASSHYSRLSPEM